MRVEFIIYGDNYTFYEVDHVFLSKENYIIVFEDGQMDNVDISYGKIVGVFK